MNVAALSARPGTSLRVPLPPRALARGGEGSGVGGKQHSSNANKIIFTKRPPPCPLSLTLQRATLPAASRGEGKGSNP